MARNRIHSTIESARDERGFTLFEILTVCAILGVLATLAFPSIRRFNRAQETKSGATMMAGVLEEARSRAVSEATPHLVYVNDPSEGGGGGGGCGPIAVVVRDSDRSYSVTDGDRVQEFSLPSGSCEDVKLYGKDASATPYETLALPSEDQAVLSAMVGTVTQAVSGEESSSGSGSGGTSGKTSTSSGKGSGSTVERAVVNGSTFPVDATTGKPVIAFSERGIPVDPSNPTNWGSGAGAIYLTDGQETVYAAIVQPMGGVKLRKFDPSSAEWR